MGKGSWSALLPDLRVSRVIPFSQQQEDGQQQQRRGRKSHGIDIRRYYQLIFDPSIPLESAIEQLYKTGLVDLVEPDYLHSPLYVPNDPRTSEQYYLELVRAFEAWDISKSSREVVIAILDSGVELNHPDLRANIYTNEKDPIDGLDNDEDGYIDNYWGWDFAGSDYSTLVGDNDPNADKSNMSHGTVVAGCASAVTDNGIGIAGVGFNARLMVLKHTADNDERNNGGGYLLNLLQGVVYAAEHGADVINASYGSTYYSQIAQDIYKYAALVHDVVIVAAAGNSGSATPNYPSDYDYVLSVAATDKDDRRAGFSSYGDRVDIAAPGAGILSTAIGGTYRTASGTSFSAPIVSGAAALLKTKYPDFNGAQIAELLRVTANPAFNEALSEPYKNKMGRGRLDVLAALTTESPSIRFDNAQLQGPDGDVVKAGEEASLSGDFINFLWPAEGVSVTLSSSSSHVMLLESTIQLGSMGSEQVKSTGSTPFRFKLSAATPSNTELTLRLDYTAAGGYRDYQYVRILVNPTYFTLNENLVSTTIAGNGRTGYRDTERKQGLGFVYNDLNLLFEMGLLMGTSSTKMVSSIRSTGGTYSDDFRELEEIRRDMPGTIGDVDIWGSFDDSKATTDRKLGVEVRYRAYAWREVPYEKTVILEYEVLNTRAQPLENFYIGLYADWDINQQDSNDKADWDAGTQTGYIYTPDAEERWVGAIQVLSGTPAYWAIDNDQAVSGNPFGVYDGFSNEEKFRSLSSGIGRTRAGEVSQGNDVSHTVGSGPYTIQPDQSVTVAFALHGGSEIDEVLASAQVARSLYESIEEVTRPNPILVTGIDTDPLKAISIYPNPSRGDVYVKVPLDGNSPIYLTMYDGTGRQLLKKVYPSDESLIKIDLSGNTGIYLIEILQGKHRTVKRISLH
ncbi:S8 family serine peptidase [Cesiribacter andamanensis]|nr:S8 family serine peptidase [Cesiribacter andamanensis]